jgi:hypothetical protein
MIECPGSAGKRVNTQAQRGGTSKEAKARAMDRWGQSPTYTASHDPREIERSPFRGQRSRSQNRSTVRNEKSMEIACTWRLETVKAWRRSLKRRGPTCWGAVEKDAENSPQRRGFLPPFHRYRDNICSIFGGYPKPQSQSLIPPLKTLSYHYQYKALKHLER